MRFLTILLLLITGILAGTQLGKIAPLVGWYQLDGGFSLVLVGWLAALIGIFVALAAFPVGVAIRRVGTRKASAISFGLLAVGALWLAVAEGSAIVLAARLVEALGYVILVVAVPALLADLSPPDWRGPVMAIWGGFVPIGFAFANLLAVVVVPEFGERTFLTAIAILFAVFALLSSLVMWRVADVNETQHVERASAAVLPHVSVGQPVWLLSIAFGIYVVSSLGFFTFMPSFIEQNGGRMLVSPAIIALLVPAGNLLAGIMMHGRTGGIALWLAAAGFVLSALASVPAFTLLSPAPATVCAAVVAISGGIVVSSLFVAIPNQVRSGAGLSVALGLVAQSGGIGTLVGPPLTAVIIEQWSWPGLGVYLAIAALLGIAALLPLLFGRRESA